jgi:5-methylcytosine-specific restriction enzyme subunit McrC
MARLYELFVAEWLRVHLPAHLELKTQEQFALNPANSLHFQIDLSLYEKSGGATHAILDTKYKAGPPTPDDIAQVMAYARVKRSAEAILVYPTPLPQPLDTTLDGLRIRSLTFALTGDLEHAGQQFLRELLPDRIL